MRQDGQEDRFSQNSSRFRVPANRLSKQSSKSRQKSPSSLSQSYTFKQKPSYKHMKPLPTSFLVSNMFNQISEEPLNPYWSESSTRGLVEIVSDESKLTRFVQNLNDEVDSQQLCFVNQMLGILLYKIKQNNPDIKKEGDSLTIEFNKNIALQNQLRIDELRRELEQKEKQIAEVSAGYLQIIHNYMDVIEDLANGVLIEEEDGYDQ